MLKCYCHDCGGRGVPYYTTSLYGLIPPLIKRAKTLVSYVVDTVISVKANYINNVIPVAANL